MEFYVREALPKLDEGITIQEKFGQSGIESLRDGELLVLCLGIPEVKVRKALEQKPLSQLLDLPFPELEKLFGKDKAQQLSASIELVKRLLQEGLGILPAISCPADAIPFLADIKDEKREHFLSPFLNARNQVIHREVISIGSLSASIVHPREILCAVSG